MIEKPDSYQDNKKCRCGPPETAGKAFGLIAGSSADKPPARVYANTADAPARWQPGGWLDSYWAAAVLG